MNASDFLQRLNDTPLLCDGGMGTQLSLAGLAAGGCGVAWNVDNAAAVEAIHRRYAQAGCDLLTTNSFCGAGPSLALHGEEGRVADLNRAAARVARRAVTNGQLVLGDVGPFGGFIEPLGDTTPDEALAIFTQQIEALCEGGADAVIIETMSDAQELAAAVQAAKLVADWPVIATFCFQKAGDRFVTLMGMEVKAAIQAAIDAGADVVGTNCGTALSLEDYVALARQIVQAAGDHPTIVQPNAGSPIEQRGELHYAASPDGFAAAVEQILAAGVRIVGGCCGTTPAHIAAASPVVHAR